MSTKERISTQNNYGLYQDCFYSAKNQQVNPNPVVVQIDNPQNYSIVNECLNGNLSHSELLVEIPAETFDAMALAWCKKRGLQDKMGQ